MNHSSSRLFLCLAVFLLLCGCVRQTTAAGAAAPESLTALHQGSLALPRQANAPKLIYVDVQKNAQMAPHLADYLGKALATANFRVADAPSKAGHILHVNILQEGQADGESVRQAVNAGYGKNARFKGAGAHAILADALMVQRKVPSHQRPSRQRMKNASSRNALGSAQMRLAVMDNGGDHEPSRDDFSQALAQELARQITAPVKTAAARNATATELAPSAPKDEGVEKSSTTRKSAASRKKSAVRKKSRTSAKSSSK